jgi:hypothetical protein
MLHHFIHSEYVMFVPLALFIIAFGILKDR